MSPVTSDRLGSAFMLLFVVSLWVQRAYTTPFGAMFPDFVMGVVVLLVIASLALSFRRRPAASDAAAAKAAGARISWGDMAVVGILLAGWAMGLRTLGFAACSVLGFGAISWYLADRRRDPRVIASSFVVGAAVTAVLVLVFGRLLLVPLPPGRLFE